MTNWSRLHLGYLELLPLGVEQLVHGAHDNIVPFETNQRYYVAAQAKGGRVELVALEDAGHFELIDAGSREWMQILREVIVVLGK